MADPKDSFPGLSARRVARLASVLPQTRDTWGDRGLLKKKGPFSRLDLLELVVLARLQAALPKAEVPIAWSAARPLLRDRLWDVRSTLVWDAERNKVSLSSKSTEIVKAVVHGRPIRAIPIGDDLRQARESYAAEAAAWARQQAQNDEQGPDLRAAEEA